MKRTLLILFSILSLNTLTHAQKTLGDKGFVAEIFNHFDWLREFNNDSIRYCKGIKCKGNIIDTHDNGKIKFKATYKDGFPIGFTQAFYDNGKLKEEGYVKKGVRVGQWKLFYQNGKLQAIENFSDQILSEEISFNYPLKSISYYENGAIKTYKEQDNKLTTIQSYTLNSKGDTLFSYTLIDAKNKIFQETKHFDNGQIKLKGKYKSSYGFRIHKIGIWRTFNEEGKMIREQNYASN